MDVFLTYTARLTNNETVSLRMRHDDRKTGVRSRHEVERMIRQGYGDGLRIVDLSCDVTIL